MVFETISNFFGSFWDLATDFLILIFVIIWAVMFFIVQYALIKAYIWLGKGIYNILIHLGVVTGKVANNPPEAVEE